MPRVPTDNVPSVAPIADRRSLQTGRGATPDAFGAQVAEGVRDVGQSIATVGDTGARIANNQQIIENERKSKELDVLYTRRKNQILYGDSVKGTPGYYRSRGSTAVDTAPTVQTQLMELREEIGGQAGNKAVHDAFMASSGNTLLRDEVAINRFVTEQSIVAANTASTARIKEAGDNAALAWNDPNTEAQSLAIIENETHSKAQLNGWDPETTQSALEEARTNMYRTMLTTILQNGNAQQAKAKLAEVRGSMDAPVAAEMDAMITRQSDAEQEQLLADRIMAETPNSSDALRAARAIQDPNVRDGVVRRVNQRIAENERNRKAVKREVAGQTFEHIWNGGTLQSFAKSNPSAFNIIAGDALLVQRLQRAEDNVAEGRVYSRTSDGVTFTELSTMSPLDLVRTNPDEYRAFLEKSEYNRYLTMRRGAQESLDQSAATYEPYRYADTQLKRLAPNSLKWDQAKQGSDLEKQQNLIRNTVYENLRAQMVLNGGKKPSADQIIDIVNNAFTVVEVPEEGTINEFFGFTDDPFAGELRNFSPEQRARATVDLEFVDKDRVAEAEEYLRSRGVDPTVPRLEAWFGAEAIKRVDPAMARQRQRAILGSGNQ